MRCLTLALKLSNQGHSCEFVCRQFTGNDIQRITRAGFAVHLLNPVDESRLQTNDTSTWVGVSTIDDLFETLAVVDAQIYDWVILDHYGLDSVWQEGIKSVCKKLCIVDDLCNRNLECDLIINQNGGIDSSMYAGLKRAHTKLLIGPKYAMLRDEFAMWRPVSLSRRSLPEKRKILVSMGGLDVVNATSNVLMVLAAVSRTLEISVDVVLGVTAPNVSTVRTIMSNLSYESYLILSPPDMAKVFTFADVAIGAGGSTCWERCCLGLPTFQVAVADNQQRVCSYLEQMNVARGFQSITDFEIRFQTQFESTTVNDLSCMMVNSSNICDGLGCTRIVELLVNLCE